MKTILLFLYLISCSYCINMTQVTINTKTSLPTNTSEDKYFYLTNSNYYSYSNIYICLEDNGYELRYYEIKICSTSTNPSSSPDSAVSGCTFTKISYYTFQISSSTNKFYFKIPNNSSYSYSIFYYYGSYSSGNLYVTSNYKDSAPTTKITSVPLNNRTSLPTTTSEINFFYITNIKYSSRPEYIYFCLEDNNFGLSLNSIRYCSVDTDPSSSPDIPFNGCYFSPLSYYSIQISSSTTKYYYKIHPSVFDVYEIVYYDGRNSSGNLYVTSNYKNLAPINIMTQLSRNIRISLPTTSSYSKYFFLTNSNYYSYSSYIYIYLEDYDFFLIYDNIQYCQTDTDPISSTDKAVMRCRFTIISNYSKQSGSNSTKYYYKIPITSSYNYSIVYYNGRGKYGSIYVTSDYNDFRIKMTKAYRGTRISLPTTTLINKYFYITNSDYYSHSSYFYFYLEDNNFSLDYNNITYCVTNIDPHNNASDAVNNCSFISISYYDPKYLSDSTRYHYKFPINSSYTYSIVYYQGSNSSGSLYVYGDYESTSNDDNSGLSIGIIIGIIAGSIVFLFICIIIIYYCCPCCRKNKNDSLSETEPNNVDPNSLNDPSNQPDNILPPEQ